MHIIHTEGFNSSLQGHCGSPTWSHLSLVTPNPRLQFGPIQVIGGIWWLMVAESSLAMASNVATFEEKTKRYEINQHADVKMYLLLMKLNIISALEMHERQYSKYQGMLKSFSWLVRGKHLCIHDLSKNIWWQVLLDWKQEMKWFRDNAISKLLMVWYWT